MRERKAVDSQNFVPFSFLQNSCPRKNISLSFSALSINKNLNKQYNQFPPPLKFIVLFIKIKMN